jgi:hypothetical protein
VSNNKEAHPEAIKRRPHSNEHLGGIPEPTQHDQSPAIGNISATELRQLLRHKSSTTTMLYFKTNETK